MIPFFNDKKIVLASASPRRLETLKQIGVEPLVYPVDVTEEHQLHGSSPAYLVRKNARLKAKAALGKNPLPGSIIIGADTVVVWQKQLLGKPKNPTQAVAMLRMLSAKRHRVYTGICLIDSENGHSVCGSSRTMVSFAFLTEQEIESYVATGEPLDKAGAYGIQGLGGLFVNAIHGDYTTVVGLSLPLLKRLARRLLAAKNHLLKERL